jgi:nucleoside-diphosphate-sugar epimerase
MVKLAMVGANGQVGAELCLLLAARKDIELVAICRNRSGSAFLRWQGIACRHGRVADPAEAARLLGDCDVVVNSSLAAGNPAQIRRAEAHIIRNIFGCSKDSATIIHFSTQSVYGDPRPGRWIRWRNPYGRAKLATERHVRAESRKTKRPAYVLRLGHVCGALQEISHGIRESIRANTVVLPAEDCSSNTVYTAAIIGAIEQIVRHAARPGTYDLMNTPRWTWREVYEYEARNSELPFSPRIGRSRPVSLKSALSRPAARFAAVLAGVQPVRDSFAKLFAYVPDGMNARAMAWWYAKRAQAEIASLRAAGKPAEHLSWVTNGVNFFPAQSPTAELLQSTSTQTLTNRLVVSWPADLADAGNKQLSAEAVIKSAALHEP